MTIQPAGEEPQEPTPEQLARAKNLREGDVDAADAARLMRSIAAATQAKLDKERKVTVVAVVPDNEKGRFATTGGMIPVKINLAQTLVPPNTAVSVPESVAKQLRLGGWVKDSEDV